MPRYAFQLRVKQGAEAEYDRRHRSVWPDLLQEFKEAGVHRYSIFRRGQVLFLYLESPSFESFLLKMRESPTNAAWQKFMEDVLESVPDKDAEEPFAMMEEVFHYLAE